MEKMKLPQKIEPCPIIDALFEIRFDTKMPLDAVFGIVYQIFAEEYNKPIDLPILEIPAVIRKEDPTLKYKPHHRMENDDFVLQIGPNMISFSSYPSYSGWYKFSNGIYDVILLSDTIFSPSL